MDTRSQPTPEELAQLQLFHFRATFPDRATAVAATRALVAERLVARGDIVDCFAVYRDDDWGQYPAGRSDRVIEADEVVVTYTTSLERMPDAAARLDDFHDDAHVTYWLAASTTDVTGWIRFSTSE